MKIIRVFPRRTNATPDDDLAILMKLMKYIFSVNKQTRQLLEARYGTGIK